MLIFCFLLPSLYPIPVKLEKYKRYYGYLPTPLTLKTGTVLQQKH